MSTPPFLDRFPRPIVFGLYGTIAGLLAALTFGELVWWMLRPSASSSLALVAPVGEVDRMRPPARSNSGRLAVTASPRVSIYPGGTNTVTVRVARDRFDGPVSFVFAAPPPVRGNPATVLAGETSIETLISAPHTAKPGMYRLTALATATPNGEVLTESAVIEVTVLPPPPPAPRLAVSVSPLIHAYQRGKNTFTVKIVRGDFDDDVSVTFDRLPEGVTIPSVTIPAGQTEATVGVVVAGDTKIGRHAFLTTARGPRAPIVASAETTIQVFGSPKLPVDVVLVLDCTGSMGKVVNGLDRGLKKLGTELAKAQLDASFGLVGFQDTTLGQPLKVARFGDDRMTADIDRVRTEMTRLRLGGGGGDGSSSLDGLAEAADSPFRDPTTRVLLLITDDGPKRFDSRIKGTAEAVKHIKDRKIDQVHIVAMPEHRKPFEPILEGARGKFFDLKAAIVADDFDKLATELGRAVWESLPERPETKPIASADPGVPPLPPVGLVAPPPLPSGIEPDEPRIDPVALPPVNEEPVTGHSPSEPKGSKTLVAVGWVGVVAGLVCVLLLIGQRTFLPGEVPSVEVGAIGYGCGLVVGMVAGALGFVILESLAGAFMGRLAAGCGLGLGIGLLVPLPQLLLGRDSAGRAVPLPEQEIESLELDAEPTPVAVMKSAVTVPAVKPNIAPPKPVDGCPGCGRAIPGAVGARYCMVCDNTF